MKKILLAGFLLAAVFNLHAKAIRDTANLTDGGARTSYAFGMMFGSELASSGIQMELDYNLFLEGLRDMMEKREPRLSEEEAIQTLQTTFENAEARKNEESKLKESLFLAENGARSGVTTTASGLQYEVLTEGAGTKPTAADLVRVHYEGKLLDDTIFDSTQNHGEPAELPVGAVIPGWAEGIQLMSAGSKYRFYIPSALAYGEHGAGGVIPPYSALIFTVELLEIIPSESGADEADNGGAGDSAGGETE